MAQLTQDQNLILHLKLPDAGEALRIEGSIAWLGPTRKQAGICFRDVPDFARQRISEWIAKQGAPTDAAGLKAASPAKPSPTTSRKPAVPPPITNLQTPSLVKQAEPDINYSTVPPGGSPLGNALPDSDASRPGAPLVFAAPIPAAIPTLPIHFEERSAASIVNPSERSPEPIQPIPQPELRSRSGYLEELPGRKGALPALLKLFSPAAAVSGDEWVSSVPILSSLGMTRRQTLVVAGLTASFTFLALIFLMITDHPRYHRKADSSATPVLNVSPPTAITPSGPASGTVGQSQEMASQSQQQAMPSATVPSSYDSTNAPIPAPHKIARRGTEAQWVAVLRKMFAGINGTTVSDPGLVAVPVWTYGRSGYYYCADSPYYEKLQPGSIMTQSDALQSGYQPKLGSYCH